MESRDAWLSTLSIVSAFLLLFATSATADGNDSASWDMVVAFGNEIYLFKNDTEILKSKVANISVITALAYDSVNRTLYISDKYHIRSDVVEGNLDSELTFNLTLHTSDMAIWSMVFDPVTKTLFWVGSEALMKMEVASYGIDSSPKITKLHDFILTSTYDLTLDICHRFIYWTNNGGQRSSIERSRLDGTDKEEILRSDPPVCFYGLTVDHYGGKLYFGTSEFFFRGNIRIEESNLDGTNRRVLVNNHKQRPMPGCPAVDDTAVYWAQTEEKATIWKVYKNGTAMRAIKEFDSLGSLHLPSTILTRHDAEGIDCKAVLDEEQIRTLEQLPAHNQTQVAA